MKQILLLFLLSLSFASQGQHPFCGQAQVTDWFFKDHPEKLDAFLTMQREFKEKRKGPSQQVQNEPAYTIPVVFHILHQGGSENITDAQVHDQIRILNRDFQKQNADTSAIVDPFKPLIANVGFAFKLARIDPNGKCTNGIVRHNTSRTLWDANDFSYFAYTWPREKYLNIYVVKTINITATAYAFLPGTPIPPSADVIVTLHNMVGSLGTGTVGNSRVLTHEVAHWFNIQHIWGTSNQPGVTCGDDLVDDTPETKGWVSCNTTNNGICNPGIRENVQNYMDYSPCKIMFTLGQADRMLSTINSTVNGRNNVPSLANRIATGIEGEVFACLPVADFKVDANRTCVNTPVSFIGSINTGSVGGSRLWHFEGGTPATSTDSLPVVTYSAPGLYTVSLKVTSVHGSDSVTRVAYIRVDDGSNGSAAPYVMDFETDSLVAKLPVENPDENSIGWMPFSFAGAMGSPKSFLLNSYDDALEIKGERDVFELPYLDLTGVNNVELSYWYSYARREVSQRDSFKVQYSLNCGRTWTSIAGLPTIVQMSAATGGISTDAFTPTGNQWAKQLVPASRLTALANQSGVKFRFLFRKDMNRVAANNLFLDEITVGEAPTGNLKSITTRLYPVFPNPTHDRFTIRWGEENVSPTTILLFDAQGRHINHPGLFNYSNQGEVVVNSDDSLEKGIYTLWMNTGEFTLPQKLVVM